MNEQYEPTNKQKDKPMGCLRCARPFVSADLTRLDVEGHPRLSNVGLTCPHCGWFGHIFVEDARIRRRRVTVALRQKDFNRKKTRGNLNRLEKAQLQ